MEIDAEAAGEVDANERLRPGFAQEAPPAIPLGMDRHGGAVGALLGCQSRAIESLCQTEQNTPKLFLYTQSDSRQTGKLLTVNTSEHT